MRGLVRIPADVHDVLSRSSVAGNTITLPEQLERSHYMATDKVLKAMGGKWNRSKGGHEFPGGINDDLAEALASGKVVDQKKALEQFFTPTAVAAQMASRAAILPGQTVLEPSAGRGALIDAALCHRAKVIAVEHDPVLFGLLNEKYGRARPVTIYRGDFLEWVPPPVGPIDAVLMNPPFSAEIAHVTRALRFLKSGGRLVAAMSPAWTSRGHREYADFRAMVERMGGVWTPLPEGTFREAGTNVSSGLLFLYKPGL